MEVPRQLLAVAGKVMMNIVIGSSNVLNTVTKHKFLLLKHSAIAVPAGRLHRRPGRRRHRRDLHRRRRQGQPRRVRRRPLRLKLHRRDSPLLLQRPSPQPLKTGASHTFSTTKPFRLPDTAMFATFESCCGLLKAYWWLCRSNLGRMPVCVADGVSIGQGGAIAQYIASTHGLMGSGPAEAGQIVSIAEALRELDQAYRGLVPYGAPLSLPLAATVTSSSTALLPDPDSVLLCTPPRPVPPRPTPVQSDITPCPCLRGLTTSPTRML